MENTRKILIVEDETPLLDSYAELVETAGYVAMKALDGYQGLDLLANNLDQIDLVLLDLMMPGVDGLEVLKTIKNMGASSYLVKTDLDYEGLVKELDKFLG
ncbi:MAG: two-component response regulator [candidate division WS6 bacterium GW2011_GWF1_33_233]|nr:MAG: two-component response regulator [candidate division WS6 bacterium GW2011_GWF1_33_233]